MQVWNAAAHIVAEVERGNGSVRAHLYSSSVPARIRPVVNTLASETLRNLRPLQTGIDSVQLLEGFSPQERSLALVLAYASALGEGKLKGGHGLVQRVREKRVELGEAVRSATGATSAPTRAPRFPRFIRINTLATTEEQVVKALGEPPLSLKLHETPLSQTRPEDGIARKAFRRDGILPNVLALPPSCSLHGHPLVEGGQVIVQDRASCLSAVALAPEPGWHVVDACAAPGNKTTHVAMLVGTTGRVFAFERNHRRADTLRKMVKIAGADRVAVREVDFLRADWSDKLYADVKGFVVDPSCSGSGNVAGLADTSVPEGLEEERRVERLVALQRSLVSHALSHPTVHTVVYSTCSIYRAENEDVVQAMLDEWGGSFHLETVLPSWPHRGLHSTPVGLHCLRAGASEFTHGFFVAKFVRSSAPQPVERVKRQSPPQSHERQKSQADMSTRRTTAKHEPGPTTAQAAPANRAPVLAAPATLTGRKRSLDLHPGVVFGTDFGLMYWRKKRGRR